MIIIPLINPPLFLNSLHSPQLSDNVHNAIRIHHALATRATDYTKKQHVFRLQTAEQSEYLFQTSDPKELQSWIDTINYVCASFSAPPLEGGVGSQKRYQRPLLPTSHTKLLQVCMLNCGSETRNTARCVCLYLYCRRNNWRHKRRKSFNCSANLRSTNRDRCLQRDWQCRTIKRKTRTCSMR